ncbi:NERD domain-containing protein [Halobacillus salinus]|uniref:NERD domain-containing protein n=1 Tax=Halobacillus salinus TaxID=192814 RepID=A0A4Z0GYE0_9BACI|nr:NERD domain-containing protein [Halobacillus salinus]
MIKPDQYVLNDLLLTHNHSIFQVDSVLVTSAKAYLFEVKNYEGNHVYQEEQFHRMPNTELTNPLHQLQRSHSLFSQLLKKLGYSMKIESYVIFVNPSFMLYQAPMGLPIIYPSQVESFLESIMSKLDPLTPRHLKLGDKLRALHHTKMPIRYVPDYDFDSLKKGVCCVGCRSLPMVTEGRFCICRGCGRREPFSEAVMRSVRELQILFPNMRTRTRVVYEWCGSIGSTKRVQKVLKAHMTMKGENLGAYYE